MPLPRLTCANGSIWFCQICGDPTGTVTRKALNGLPIGVIACDPCRRAVQDRIVGVTVRHGKISIVDARVKA